jgi:hypothetical protein
MGHVQLHFARATSAAGSSLAADTQDDWWIFKQLSPCFDKLYSRVGRPSIAPERLLRALLLQVLYSVRSERMLMEQLQYNMLFRWFVGFSSLPDLKWHAID